MALTLQDLIKESEQALWYAVDDSNRQRSAAAVQVTSDFRLLELWRRRHQALLQPVSEATGRQMQSVKLRGAAVALIERCALVDYLREYSIEPATRDVLLTRFRGGVVSRNALLAEHRNYVLALCSLVCVDRLLDSLGDLTGPRLLQHYSFEYLGLFATFCNKLIADESTVETPGRVELSTEVRHLKRVLMQEQEEPPSA